MIVAFSFFYVVSSFFSSSDYSPSTTPSSNTAPARAASSTYIGKGNALLIVNTFLTCNSNYLILQDSISTFDFNKSPYTTKNDSFGIYLQYLTNSLLSTTAYNVVAFYLKTKKPIDDDLALTLYKKA